MLKQLKARDADPTKRMQSEGLCVHSDRQASPVGSAVAMEEVRDKGAYASTA
jgi:hypothetical protein